MRNICELKKKQYFQQNKVTVTGSPEDLRTWIYQLKDNGLFVREILIDSGKHDNNIVEIVQLSDLHINYFNKKDMGDEELLLTRQHRKWNANAACIPAIQKAMEYAMFFDQTMITGDTLDFLSEGAIELMHKYIWDVDPDVLIALGGHELVKQMQTGIKDKTPLEVRRRILEKAWKHDIYYVSKVIKNKVIVVALDNGNHEYFEEQLQKLTTDIKMARENGYVILLFQHEAISTGKPEDANKECFRQYDGKYQNFYNDCIGNDEQDNQITREMYRLITENADVIKGLFCGHYHSAYYTEVKASYIDEKGEKQETYIPQPVLTPSAYDNYAGHVMKIKVI